MKYPICLQGLVFFALTFVLTSLPSHSFAQETQASQADPLAGNWCGSWRSGQTGHHGKLRATFCRIGKSQVEAVFTGSFAKILPFRYKATLEIVHEEPGKIQLRGAQQLGPIMGTFSYAATVTADQFVATYQSRKDCGKWTMEKLHSCCR
ncbi:MAG: hypothetical protein VX438_01270 [Planctomycetota bacterium]|nr:hypothetical protein [Planctomycetota bacterium]